jgi:hypothetical protein
VRTLEAKILDSTHLELREPILLPPGRSIEISITADRIERATRRAAAEQELATSTEHAEAPGLSPPRRARELAWRRAHEDELQAYAGQWVVLEGEEIVAHGEDPASAAEQARSQGVHIPYVFYVEEYRPDVVLIGL